MADTPNLAVFYCPDCFPERDPVEEILAVRWCEAHRPADHGADDERARVSADILIATGDVEGSTNRQWCELIHRAGRLSSPRRAVPRR